jgi:hypothetical protein
MKKNLPNPLFLCIFVLATPALADFTQADSAKAKAYCRGEFIGTTITTEKQSEASSRAKSEIISNIISEVEAQVNISDSKKELSGGRIETSSSFSEISQIKSKMVLHDFQQIESPRRLENGLYELKGYVCKSNVAKPYLEKQRFVADSFSLAANTELNTKHPKHKNAAWKETRRLWIKFMNLQELLEVLGFKSSYPVNEIYAKTKANYEDYCRDSKIFWQDDGNECSSTIFAMLSNKIKMEKSKCTCTGGLRLSLSCPEKCSGSSIDIECSINPILSIESCGGEEYSKLKIEGTITGSHSRNKSRAMEDLVDNLSKATFFNEWEKEIMGWIPQCVE